MHSPLKLAFFALLGISSIVNAAPGGESPPGYTHSTKKTTTTPNGGHSTKTTCSSVAHPTWSTGHHVTSTCKPTTIWTETTIPYTKTVTTSKVEQVTKPVTSETTKTKIKTGYSSCNGHSVSKSISVQTIYSTHTVLHTGNVPSSCPYTSTKIKTKPVVGQTVIATTSYGQSLSTGESTSKIEKTTCSSCAVTVPWTSTYTSWETKCATIGGYGK